MSKALGIVYRAIASHLFKNAGKTQKTAQTGSVTLIQRFGSALNLNVHFHMLFLDGVYAKNKYGKATFQRTNAPTQEELAQPVHTISHRVSRYLERQGILDRIEAEKMKGKVSVTRFKGLGEMNPLQLRETSIAPDTRRLVQLTLDGDNTDENGVKNLTDELMDMLLSKKRAGDRKQWLEQKGDMAEEVL